MISTMFSALLFINHDYFLLRLVASVKIFSSDITLISATRIPNEFPVSMFLTTFFQNTFLYLNYYFIIK